MSTRPRSGNLELLEHIIEVTSADLDVGEVSQRVAALVTAATRSDVCFVHLVDEELRRVVLAGATPPFDEQVGIVQLALGEGIAGWVAKFAQPAVVPDKWKDRRYRYIPELRGEDFPSMVSVPMVARGRVVGVLNVHSRAARNYGDEDLALLTQVANVMARAIENARLYRPPGRAGGDARALRHPHGRGPGAGAPAAGRRDPRRDQPAPGQPLVPPAGRGGRRRRPRRLRRELGKAKELATAALDEARAAITGLRPFVLDDLGLGPGLESLGRSLVGIEVEVDVEPVDLPAHVEVALYRIAQEALQNVVKHAEATSVLVRLAAADDGVRLVVTDDGQGFDEDIVAGAEDRHSYGLVGIRERAELIGASLTLTSRPGTGTTVEVLVPVPDHGRRKKG